MLLQNIVTATQTKSKTFKRWLKISVTVISFSKNYSGWIWIKIYRSLVTTKIIKVRNLFNIYHIFLFYLICNNTHSFIHRFITSLSFANILQTVIYKYKPLSDFGFGIKKVRWRFFFSSLKLKYTRIDEKIKTGYNLILLTFTYFIYKEEQQADSAILTDRSKLSERLYVWSDYVCRDCVRN